jgi:putative ABC transport system permease protein
MSTLRLAASGARAHRGSLAGTFLVLALAGALLSMTGVLIQSGSGPDGGILAALAGSFAGTAIVVVMLVVASTVALGLRQRRRELALLRAVGATRQQVRGLVGAELALVTAVAAPLGAIPGLLLTSRLTPMLVEGGVVPEGFHLSVTPGPAVAAVLLLLPVALVAAALATRETLRAPVTEAVRESTVEPRTIGRGRRITALSLAVLGLGVALTPVLVSGVIGSATAASSAFLLVGAAALAGPLVVAWMLGRDAVLRRVARGASGRLALANTRGFSRRLTTAVVPLALALAAGTVQTTTDRTVIEAASRQLADGLHADLVVTPGDGHADAGAVLRTPGVTAAAPISAVTAQVRTDEDDVPGFDGLSWETASVQVLPTRLDGLLDPGVVDGSLAGLARPDTVAVSTDALLGTGIGVGETVGLRLGGQEGRATVVATYERGLGFGDYLTGQATQRAHDVEAGPVAVLVRASEPDRVAAALAGQGMTTVSEAAYVDDAVDASAGERRLSAVLLLALLAFIALAAANTLVMTTAARREELALLRRTGATPRQLVTMASVEALIAAATAWAIGTAAVIPAVLGVGFGLLGPSGPRLDLTTYAALSGLVLLISLTTVVPTVARQLRGTGGRTGA